MNIIEPYFLYFIVFLKNSYLMLFGVYAIWYAIIFKEEIKENIKYKKIKSGELFPKKIRELLISSIFLEFFYNFYNPLYYFFDWFLVFVLIYLTYKLLFLIIYFFDLKE